MLFLRSGQTALQNNIHFLHDFFKIGYNAFVLDFFMECGRADSLVRLDFYARNKKTDGGLSGKY